MCPLKRTLPRGSISSGRFGSFRSVTGQCSCCTTWKDSITRRSRACLGLPTARRGRNCSRPECNYERSSGVAEMHPNDLTLQAYVDGELDTTARTEVNDHVAGCAGCRQLV